MLAYALGTSVSGGLRAFSCSRPSEVPSPTGWSWLKTDGRIGMNSGERLGRNRVKRPLCRNFTLHFPHTTNSQCCRTAAAFRPRPQHVGMRLTYTSTSGGPG
eukprot:3740360-Amphidinium_carterae.1